MYNLKVDLVHSFTFYSLSVFVFVLTAFCVSPFFPYPPSSCVFQCMFRSADDPLNNLATSVEVDSSSINDPKEKSPPTPTNEDVDSTAASGGGQNPAAVQHKWPLRPGVHVHVNGLHNLNNNNNNSASEGEQQSQPQQPAVTAAAATTTTTVNKTTNLNNKTATDKKTSKGNPKKHV